jgi:hypothetical protein
MIVVFLKRLKYYKSYVIVIERGIFKKMKISDRINMIDRIRSNPVYPANPVKRYD